MCTAAAIRSMLWRSFRHHLFIALSALETKGLYPSNKLRVRGLLALPNRSEEVRCGQQIPQSLGFHSFMPQVTSCPGCARTTSTYFQELAERIQGYLIEQVPEWKKQYVGVEELGLAVMGCIVNEPGESKHANIGISLPGTFEELKAPVYVDRKLYSTLKGDRIVEEFQEILNEYVEKRYGKVLVEA